MNDPFRALFDIPCNAQEEIERIMSSSGVLPVINKLELYVRKSYIDHICNLLPVQSLNQTRLSHLQDIPWYTANPVVEELDKFSLQLLENILPIFLKFVQTPRCHVILSRLSFSGRAH